MVDIWGWMGNLVSTYGYAGAFIISLFGNFTIFFPVPFVLTIYAFGATLNPLLLGVVCGFGSTIGKQLENAKKLVQKYGVSIIFLFAILPLPDDVILIPLGMLRYDLKKAMIAMFTGKSIMCIGVAYAGKYSYTIVRDFFKTSGILGGFSSVLLLVLVIILLLTIDWTQFLEFNDIVSNE
jgi:membrane protein YqaA with SNARE-associated domain